jgi:hypothetical protein
LAREYIVSGGGLTITGASTLVFLNPSANVGIEILRCWIGQTNSTTNAQQRVQLVFQATAFPTLTSATPAKTNLRDPASALVGGTAGAAGTAGINASAEGAGTKTVILNDVFATVNGWLWLPTPLETISINANESQGFGLYLPVAPGTLTNWTFGVTYRELN